MNNLAVLLNDLGRQTGDMRMLREAEPLKREALAGCREVLGNRHPHTLASVANLAASLCARRFARIWVVGVDHLVNGGPSRRPEM